MDRYLRTIISGTDLLNDITYFRLSRAMAVIDTVCQPILDEHAGKPVAETGEAHSRQLTTVQAEPA